MNMLEQLAAIPEDQMTSAMKTTLKQLQKQLKVGSDVADTVYNKRHFDAGFELLEERWDNKEDAKAFAQDLRENHNKNAAYVSLKFGRFGVFSKDAEVKESKSRSFEARCERALNSLGEKEAAELRKAFQTCIRLLELAEPKEAEVSEEK